MQHVSFRRHLSGLLVMALVGLACRALSVVPPTPSVVIEAPPTSAPATVTPLPALPPTDGWIAFVNQNNVWIVHPDGSSLQQVTSNPYPAQNNWASNIGIRMAWAPDGASLAFTQGAPLYLVDLTTLRITLLAQGTNGSFGWSPDGQTIMYGTRALPSDQFSDDGLWAVDLDDGDAQRITPGVDGFWQPKWSPDGTHVLFANPGIDPNGNSVMSMSAQQPVRLPTNAMGGTGAGACEWSAEPLIACITVSDQLPFDPVLRLIDTDGSLKGEFPLPEDIGVNESDLRWSPDGSRLALSYILRAFGIVAAEARLNLFSPDTGELRALGAGYASDWSPDGSWIVAYDMAWDDDQLPRLMTIVHAATGETHAIVEGFFPVWQPPSAVAPPVPTQGAPEAAGTGTPGAAGSVCTSTDITRIDTPKGDYLQMCAAGQEFEIGPLENGGYAMGPNGKFFVYCANSGRCYAARVGDTRLTAIGSVKDFAIIRKGQDPLFRFEFHGDDPYRVQVFEDVMVENVVFNIPSQISAGK